MSGMGVAVIGAGNRSTIMLDYLKHNPEQGFVSGLYDVIAQRSRFLIDRHGVTGATVYKSLDEALRDPRTGAVMVATVDSEHAGPSIAALRAGKHVYCEKPMAISLEDCDAMIAEAKAAASVFYVGMNLRHGPVHEALHDLVAGGELGRLMTIEANEYYSEGRTYFRRWNGLRRYGGGLWLTKACHDFDLLNWMAGGRPTRVYATCSLGHYKPKDGAAASCRQCKLECPDRYVATDPKWDEFLAMLEPQFDRARDVCLYTAAKDTFDNGIAVVDYDNDVRATYTVNVVSARDTRQMRLMGTAGAAEGDMAEGVVRVWKRHTKKCTTIDLREKTKSSHGGADKHILADFFRCCRTGDRPRSSWAEGRSCVEVGLAATRSSDTHQAVSI